MREALIIGAGPAGSAAAILLARAGRDVLLVDRCRFPRPKPCGEYYNPDCTRLLGELGVLDDVLAAGARPVESLVLRSRGTEVRVPFSEILPPGRTEPALSLARESLDWVLLQHARQAGAEVWEETTLREPLLEAGTVRGAVVRRGSRSFPVRARVTLAADGLRSRFARRLGLGLGDGGRKRFGITGRCPVRPGAPERLEMHGGGPGCCGIAIRGGTANFGMVTDGARARDLGGDPAAFFRSELARFPELQKWVDGGPPSVLTVGPLTWRTRRQSAAGCLLLGDAAGFYDPFTGQGVTFALLTAQAAAAVAGAALEAGDVSARRLAEYGRARRRLLEPRIAVQRAIQWVVERPALYEHVLRRLGGRRQAARTLLGIVADVLPAGRALSPAFLAQLVV